jgi:type IV pilus assembly protein PilM
MFSRSFGKKSLVGLDIGSSSIKAVELQGKPGNLHITSLGYEQLLPDYVVDGQIMELNSVSSIISNIFSGQQIKTEKVVAGVSGHSVIVKSISVPAMSEEELEDSIDWHAEEHIPFDINDVSLDYQIVGRSPEMLQVVMAACKRDRISNIKQAIQLAGKQPSIIDVDAFALQNCYEINYKPSPHDVVALLNIGASTMNINIVQGIQSVFTRDVTTGGNYYTAMLQKELGLSYEQAESIKCGRNIPDGPDPNAVEAILSSASEALVLEIKKTFDFYRATSETGDVKVQKILISGGGSKVRGLVQHLTNKFEIPVEPIDPFRQIKVDNKRYSAEYMQEIMPEMAVAVGLALRGVCD